MFAKEINRMTLTNDVADRLFDNITASNYGMDKTFAATLRALLHKRLPAGESLNLALVPLGSYATAPETINEFVRQHDTGHSYTIYIVYPQDNSCGKQLLDVARFGVGEGKQYFDTYTLQEDLRVFYIRKLDGLFYIGGNSTMIFLDYLDIRRFHALQMMIPKYLPMLFAGSPLSDKETALLKCLGVRSSDEYERLIEQFALRLDMRGEIIRTRLKGFETVFEQEQACQVKRIIEKYQRDYRTTLDNLRCTLNSIQDQQIILAGLQSRIDCGDREESELMEYFLCNKQLSVIRVKGTELEFVVHGYTDIFDEEAFDIYAGNPSSYLYRGISGNVTKGGMERLYRAIFGGGAYKLRVCAAYRVDMRNSVMPLSDYVFPPESLTYLPNPHIQRFGCIGGYASRFAKYMHNRDYVGAIDQAAVSARNLNFHDSTVMETLAHALSHTAIKCIEDADGNLMTPKEAIKRLEEEACQHRSE